MAKVRVDQKRENTTRETTSRAKTAWKPASILDAPPPRDGMSQKWVSTSILGQDVSHHVLKRQREGWTPRPADTVPSNFPTPTLEHGKWKGCIGIEGMVLCEMPVEMVESRREYYSGKAREQMAFTERELSQAERAGGIPIDRQYDTSSEGGGRKLAPMDD
tara:strand:- start:1954 stop:2436 length:483 start_codon:yes stop_codon:yes gene_type:complete